MLHLSGQPNHLSPVDILLRNMERQQIQTSIDKMRMKLKKDNTKSYNKKRNATHIKGINKYGCSKNR